MAHRQTLMPHIGALLPVLPVLAKEGALGELLKTPTFDLLAPHLDTLVPALPLLAPHAAVLLPHVGTLAPHIEALTPQCDVTSQAISAVARLLSPFSESVLISPYSPLAFI